MAVIDSEVVQGGSEIEPSEVITHRPKRPAVELFAAAAAFLIPIAYAAGLDSEAWSARTAVLLVVSAFGLPALLLQSRQPRALAARSAVVFLLVGTLSALLSHNHTTAVFGLYNQGTGLLFMVSLAAAWAIGRSIRPEARSLVERALLLGIAVNVGIALLGSLVDLSALVPGPDQAGRSSALAGNPVFLAALAVLGLSLLVPRFASAPVAWGAAVLATAAAIQLSGTRVALIAVAAIVVWAGRRHGGRLAVLLALVLVAGLATGSVIGRAGSTSATKRAAGAQSAESWSVRPTTWLSARYAFAERPLLGIGPGQFRTATSRFRPDSVGRLEGPDKLFTDAHNLFIEYGTTTGVLGLGALLVWLILALKQGRGCLLVGALVVLLVHMAEPQSVVTTPLAFLALGASSSAGVARARRECRAAHLIVPVCWFAGTLLVVALFLFGEFDLRQGRLDLRVAPAAQANRILPAWPTTASLLARVWLYEAIVGRSAADVRQSRNWRLVAISRDGADPSLWSDLADLDASTGLINHATNEYLSALRFNPTSARAMDGLARLARTQCDLVHERYWTQRSLQVSPPPGTSLANSRRGGQILAPVCAGRGQA